MIRDHSIKFGLATVVFPTLRDLDEGIEDFDMNIGFHTTHHP